MNFFQRLFSRFTARGRALDQIDRGMACANKNDSETAIAHYSEVIRSSETPRDVQAMALFNRALVYTTVGQEREATRDLKIVLEMPESIPNIKRSAKDKLVRMERKLKREDSTRGNE